MESMDTNKDGVVDLEEYLAAGGTKEEFDKYDLDGDGVLDAQEMELRGAAKVDEKERSRAVQQGQAELKRMDSNKDGVVDKEEFLGAGESREEFELKRVEAGETAWKKYAEWICETLALCFVYS